MCYCTLKQVLKSDFMSDKITKMDLNGVLSPQTLLNLSGVKIGDDLSDTLDINLSRVNDNTGDYYTPTLIIFNYVRYVNNEELMGCADKKEYIKTAKKLLKELNGCGFDIGKKWRGKKLLPYSRGNKKLSKDTLIINLSPSSLCVSSNMGLCEMCGVCYALSSERRYVNTLIYRLYQLIRFEEMSVEEICNQWMRLKGVNFLRVNESGDIFNMDDVKKLLKISQILFERMGVITYLYTHRRDMWDEIKSHQTPYFKVNRSGVDYNPSPSISSNHKNLWCDGECNYCIWCKLELLTPVTSLYHGDVIGEDLRDVKTKKRDLTLKWECYKMFMSGCDVSDIISHIHSTLLIKEEI